MLIQKWGRSSAASTSVSIVDAIRSLITPTPEGDWFSTGVSLYFLNNLVYLLDIELDDLSRKMASLFCNLTDINIFTNVGTRVHSRVLLVSWYSPSTLKLNWKAYKQFLYLILSVFWYLLQSYSLQLQYQVFTSGNPYGIAEDIVFSMPCRSKASVSVLFIRYDFWIAFVPLWQKVLFIREMVIMNLSRMLYLMTTYDRN